MSITVGCDVGSLTAKVVLICHRRILGTSIIKSRIDPAASAAAALEQALLNAGESSDRIAYCVGTGYGRDKIAFAHETISEITCHGKGAHWLLPSARTVIDIGGQDSKVIQIDPLGRVINFATNDKCASGTGRFLEIMAQVLNIEMEALGALSGKARKPVQLASTCTVWAQADVIKYLNSGERIEDIGAGVNNAIANRVAILVNAINVEKDIVMTGGVAKNSGVKSVLDHLLGQRIRKISQVDPQLAGAVGAALFAQEKLTGGR